jgi:hypothetical protein
VAEGVGFEPTEARTSAVFKTAAIVHSATPPGLEILRGRSQRFDRQATLRP